MKSSKQLQQEFEDAVLNYETEYRKMMRAAANLLRKIDGKIKRVMKRRRHARKFERQVDQGQAFRKLADQPSDN